VTGDGIGVVAIWEAATGRTIREIGSPPADFREILEWPDGKIAVSPDGKILATVNGHNRLRLWDLATDRERRRWHEPKDEQYEHLAFSADGRTIAVSVSRYNENANKSENSTCPWDTTPPTERRRRTVPDTARLAHLPISPAG